MKSFTRILALAGTAAALLISTHSSLAQRPPGGGQGGPGGNFDPAEMRARMMERYREQLEVTGDAEWKIIEERVAKVTEARREVGFGGAGRGMFGMARNRGGGQGGDRPNRGGFGADPMPEAEELQKALDDKASAEVIKAKLAKYRDARKAKQANLTKAQNDLRAVLSVRQEASAVMMGLLD